MTTLCAFCHNVELIGSEECLRLSGDLSRVRTGGKCKILMGETTQMASTRTNDEAVMLNIVNFQYYLN
jgi:hypothetical protein